MKVNIIDSAIKGYHVYKIRPHLEIPMIVKPDVTNDVDEYALGVWMPRYSR